MKWKKKEGAAKSAKFPFSRIIPLSLILREHKESEYTWFITWNPLSNSHILQYTSVENEFVLTKYTVFSLMLFSMYPLLTCVLLFACLVNGQFIPGWL